MFMLKLGSDLEQLLKSLIENESKSVFKSVNNIRLKANQSLIDIEILKANLVVMHYEINNSTYRKSLIIPRGHTDWYVDSANNAIIYIAVDNWTSGSIRVSPYSTDSNNVAVVGYDLIK